MENGFLINMLEIVRYFMETSFFFVSFLGLFFSYCEVETALLYHRERETDKKRKIRISAFSSSSFSSPATVCVTTLLAAFFSCIAREYTRLFSLELFFVKQRRWTLFFSIFGNTIYTRFFRKWIDSTSLPMSGFVWNSNSQSSWVRISPFYTFFRPELIPPPRNTKKGKRGECALLLRAALNW